MAQKGSYIEVILKEELYKANTLQKVIQEAQNKGFNFCYLRIDPVVHPGDWKSTEESTTKMPILYLKKDDKSEALIMQGIKDDLYRIYNYKWIA